MVNCRSQVKIVSVLLVLVLALGIVAPVMVGASDGSAVVGTSGAIISSPLTGATNARLLGDGEDLGNMILKYPTHTLYTVYFPLYEDDFIWNGVPQELTWELLYDSGFDVEIEVISGASVLRYAEFYSDYDESDSVEETGIFLGFLARPEDEEFECAIYLTYEGNRTNIRSVSMKGVVEARKIMDVDPDRILSSSTHPNLNDLTLAPGAQIRFPLTSEDFLWHGEPKKLTVALLKSEEYGVKRKISSGSIVCQSVFLEDTEQGVDIVVSFASPIYDTKFDLDIYIAHRSSRVDWEPININGIVTGTGIGSGSGGSGSGGSGSSSGSSSSYKGSGSLADTGAVFGSFGAAASTVGADVDKEQIVAQTKQVVQNADSGTAVVRVKNAAVITLDTLKEMSAVAGTMPLALHADSLNGSGGVDVRVIVDPASATKDMNLYASTLSAQASAIQARFEKHFSNKLMVVSFGQAGEFGASVQVAVKLADGIDAENLVFYTYDSAANRYYRQNVAYTVDGNGYVRFATAVGGDMIITDGVLVKK